MEKQALVFDKEVQIVFKSIGYDSLTELTKVAEYFQSPLPYLCTFTITVDAKRKDLVEERKSERQMKIETSRKFLDCAIKMELRIVAIKVSRCQHGKQRKVLGCIVLKYFKAYCQGFFLPCHSRRKLV